MSSLLLTLLFLLPFCPSEVSGPLLRGLGSSPALGIHRALLSHGALCLSVTLPPWLAAHHYQPLLLLWLCSSLPSMSPSMSWSEGWKARGAQYFHISEGKWVMLCNHYPLAYGPASPLESVMELSILLSITPGLLNSCIALLGCCP